MTDTMKAVEAADETFPLDAEADIRVFNRVLAAITKNCTPGSLYHPEQSTRDVMDIIRGFAASPATTPQGGREEIARTICKAIYPHNWDRCCNYNPSHEKCNNSIRWGEMLRAADALSKPAEVRSQLLDDIRAIELTIDGLNTRAFTQRPETQAALDRIKARCRVALSRTSPSPEGWQLVPVQSTQEMNEAGITYIGSDDLRYSINAAKKTWNAMLAVAPRPIVAGPESSK